jgi:adenylate kinase
MNLVLLGPPGAGKGTQAACLTQQYHIPKIATGEMLRGLAQRGDEEGRRIAALIDRGQMVPDETVQALVWERLRRPDAEAGFLLDGFPRTVNQAEALERFLREDRRELTAALDLEVSEEELIRRLSGRRVCTRCEASYHLVSHPPRVPGRCDRDGAPLEQRPDDYPEAIRVRLRLYHQRTEPVLDYYRARGLLRRIEGERTMGEVTQQILRVLDERRTRGEGEPPLRAPGA